eukprot:TRINITY_DN4509_c0_g2_i14.p1 TRINITY_DN4509_c0_g2~~TRINITY_DN4509_c0_g2_i14.p1  ORF type:complete len:137 (-),score=31.33 TRINITY_DN4509_c0_g2_i14:429-839(-)
MLNDFCWVSEEARVVSKKLSSYLLLVCPGRTYVMNFDSEDDLVGWYNILKQTLENIAKNEQKNVPPLTTGFNDSWESSDSPRSKQWYQRRVRATRGCSMLTMWFGCLVNFQISSPLKFYVQVIDFVLLPSPVEDQA